MSEVGGSTGRPGRGFNPDGTPYPCAMTEKQWAFISTYLANGRNGAAAARAAGYAGNNKHLTSRAAKLLSGKKIRKYLEDQAKEAALQGKCLSPDQVLEGLSREAIKGENGHIRVSAFQVLAKYHGLLVEKVEDVTKRPEDAAALLRSLAAALRGAVPGDRAQQAIETLAEAFGMNSEDLNEPTTH
jgi:hypothetical protein